MEDMDWEDASQPTRMEGGSRVPAGDLTQDDAQAIVESFSRPLDTMRAGNAAGRPDKRRDSLLDGRDEKRRKSIDIAGGSRLTVASAVHQVQRSGEGSQLASSSGQLAEISRRSTVLDRYGRRQNMQQLSSLQIDGVKHKIFISHSGAQKDFAEHLCVDLERRGFLCPFFDQRQHSLPKGKDFAPLIKEAARHCHVAVMVLSEEFLCSKWPMIELAEFHSAQQAGNPRLCMLPLFYKLSVEDLNEKAIEERWMPMWRRLADEDARIDVAKWSGAVGALRKANGVVFGKKGVDSEVGYRKDIVQSIFMLSPPDLVYGSSGKMVGYSRVCEVVRGRFVRGTSGGPSYLGLYGVSRAGKTTLAKALCDEFRGEYMGRVCHVDLGEAPRMGKMCQEDLNAARRLRRVQLKRVKRMLERLCGVDKEALDRIHDVDEGLIEMQRHMRREPVFLAIDNVTNENSSWKEAFDYLGVGFHPESRIVITSRSKENVWDLVADIPFCVAMPSLTSWEAGELFLRSAAPSMSIFGLSVEQRRIVGLCIEQCMFDDPYQVGGGVGTPFWEDEVGPQFKVQVVGLWVRSFHPMALLALGDIFRRYFGKNNMLQWRGYLEENKDALWDVWNLKDGMGGIFGLEFHSLPSSHQLLFLDIVMLPHFFSDELEDTYSSVLFNVHEETEETILRRLQDLERCGMIKLENMDDLDVGEMQISMHDVYKRFAEWYMKHHGVKELKNAWCVFKSGGSISNGDHVASDLVRLRVDFESLATARVLESMMKQEMGNLEVLSLDSCYGVRELNLEGLVRLRYLKIFDMQNLESVSLSKSNGTAVGGGILDALKLVWLIDLQLLVHGPDVRWCTSLVEYRVYDCPSMTNLDRMECPHLKVLDLEWLARHQLVRLPSVKALCSLEKFEVESKCAVCWSDVEASRGMWLRDVEKPYLRVVEEVVLYLGSEWEAWDRMSYFYLKWRNSNQMGNNLIVIDSCSNQYRWG